MKDEKDTPSVVDRLNAVCKEVEAIGKAKSMSTSEHLTRLNRLHSLIKQAQVSLFRAEGDLKHVAQIQSAMLDAERKFETFSKSEREQLKQLPIKGVRKPEDLWKQAEKAGISRELLSKFLSILTPAFYSDIRYSASGNLMRAKLRKGADPGAKLAAQNLKDYSWRTWLAAERNEKEFFIELGKCLSDKSGKRSEWTSKMSRDVSSIFVINPNISDKDGVRELKDKYGWTMSQDNFRMWKMRLGVNKFLRQLGVRLRGARSRRA